MWAEFEAEILFKLRRAHFKKKKVLDEVQLEPESEPQPEPEAETSQNIPTI